MAKYLLGIDNGGTVTKAALYAADGAELAVAKARTKTLYPHPGHIERDLDGFWAANAQVIAQVIRQTGIDAADIAAVATAGYGSGLHLVAEDGSPAWNGIISTDSRASSYVQRYYGDGTFERVLPRICQSIWAAQPAALLPWFRDHRPDVLEKTRWILSCKDYIRFKLTGEPLCEVTDSSGTSLVNIHTLVHDPELLDAFGLSGLRDKFPPDPPLRRDLRTGHACGRGADGAARGDPGGGWALRRHRLRHRQRARRPREALRDRRYLEHQRVPEQGSGEVPDPVHVLRILHAGSLADPGGQPDLGEQPRVVRLGADAGRRRGDPGRRGGVRGVQQAGRQRGRRRRARSRSCPFCTAAMPGPTPRPASSACMAGTRRRTCCARYSRGSPSRTRPTSTSSWPTEAPATAVRFAGGAAKSARLAADVRRRPAASRRGHRHAGAGRHGRRHVRGRGRRGCSARSRRRSPGW